MTDDDILVLALVKGPERYAVMYDECTRAHALRQLGLWATDPSLSFSWDDAAVLSQKIREGEREEQQKLNNRIEEHLT